MDDNKVVVVVIIAVVGLITLLAGYTFLTDHWEDIKNLAAIALVMGGTFTLAFAGFKIKSGRG